MTTHAAQGQTCDKGAIVDLKMGGSSSTMSSYVAITRVERRKDLSIYRPFPRELFAQGQKPGLELSLKVWRREHIGWKTIQKQLTPQQLCNICGIVKYKESHFAKHSGTSHTSAVNAKRALHSVKKKSHRWIVLSAWNGDVKQRLHLISALRTLVNLVCVWIV